MALADSLTQLQPPSVPGGISYGVFTRQPAVAILVSRVISAVFQTIETNSAAITAVETLSAVVE